MSFDHVGVGHKIFYSPLKKELIYGFKVVYKAQTHKVIAKERFP